ncbi:MAG TPA: LacI family transcriptional regulator, partial [Alphaproteobacteria bacterium]|nr:LacI family transcriptional regulator [Alphaproteobacteria bacterium]
GPVSAETYRRVWDAAQAVGYAPNPVAQSLKSGRTRLIGMVMADISNPFFGRLLSEVERIAIGKDHLVIVSDSGGDAERERAILDHLSNQRVAGVIISTLSRDPAHVQHLRALSMPFVLVDQKVEGIAADFVASDNVLASAILTEHLIRFGHRRIAHIAGRAGLWTAERRLEGFRTTMAAAGIEVDESLIVDGDYEGEVAYAQAMRLLTRSDRPTAIIAANNVMALGTLQALNDLGFRCPEDVSLTSIDDVPWGNVIRPRITMVVQPVDEMARIATEFLLERINQRGGPPVPPREHILIPKLVVGQSCAPPAA